MKVLTKGMSQFIDGILYSTVPSIAKIVKNEYGLALYAQKEFHIGDQMWIDKELKLLDEDLPQKIPLITNQGEFVLDKFVHPSWHAYPEEFWGLYGFDSFVNHSCDANTHYNYVIINDGCIYDAFASKRIEIGDEITANYNTFEWDSEGDEFECFCGNINCVKNISGFKHLPIHIKLQLLSQNLQPHIKERWEKEENIIVIDDLMCPEQVEINNVGIISKKAFAKDERIYSVENTKIISSKNQKIAANVNGNYMMLDNTNYLIWRGEEHDDYIFTYFDVFMNHSCNPNVYKRNITKNTYNVYANRNIHIGEELKMNLMI
eukprot:120248_1